MRGVDMRKEEVKGGERAVAEEESGAKEGGVARERGERFKWEAWEEKES